MGTKTFPLGDVLSVTTGILVGPSHVDGVYQVVDHMEQRPHWTHELPDAAERVRGEILHRYPALAEAYPPQINGTVEERRAAAEQWVASVADYIGLETLALEPCSAEVIEALPPVDPVRTLIEKRSQ